MGRSGQMHGRPAATDAGMMRAQGGIVADPAGIAFAIDEGHADGGIRHLVSLPHHGLLRFIADRDPLLFHGDRVELAGLDFIHLDRINFGKPYHHFQELQRCL